MGRIYVVTDEGIGIAVPQAPQGMVAGLLKDSEAEGLVTFPFDPGLISVETPIVEEGDRTPRVEPGDPIREPVDPPADPGVGPGGF